MQWYNDKFGVLLDFFQLCVVCHARWNAVFVKISWLVRKKICHDWWIILKSKILYRKLRDNFNAQEECKFLVGYYALIEIVMVLYRKKSSQLFASFYRLLQMFICKFIILFYNNEAQKNLKITYNNKLPHYLDFLQSHK